MKTLRFVLTLFVAMTFFALGSSAQGNKTVEHYGPDYYAEYPFPCIGETFSGYEEVWVTHWASKTQVKAKGTFVGDITGTTYYFSYVANYKGMEWMPGGVYMGIVNASLEDEYGNVYYSTHHNDHVTVNANGEVTADFWKDKVFWSCEF